MKADQQEAARGAELLLSAIVLHRYCTNGEDEAETEEEEESSDSADLIVSPTQFNLQPFHLHFLSGMHRGRI